jgi:hypothetical protein
MCGFIFLTFLGRDLWILECEPLGIQGVSFQLGNFTFAYFDFWRGGLSAATYLLRYQALSISSVFPRLIF